MAEALAASSQLIGVSKKEEEEESVEKVPKMTAMTTTTTTNDETKEEDRESGENEINIIMRGRAFPGIRHMNVNIP